MAEAIGLGSGIITLVNLTLTVSKLSYEYVQKVRNVSQSISQYLKEVQALQSALLKIQETLGSSEVASFLSSQEEVLPKLLLTGCYTELEAVKQKLEKRDKTKSRWSFTSKAQHLTWPYQEKETLELVEKLSRWTSICNSFVSSYNLLVARRLPLLLLTLQTNLERHSESS